MQTSKEETKPYSLNLIITVHPNITHSSEIYLNGEEVISDEIIQLGLLQKAKAIIEHRINTKSESQNICLNVKETAN
jgi:hypothetical protein